MKRMRYKSLSYIPTRLVFAVNLTMDISPGGSSCPLFPRGIGIWKDDFSGEGKPEDPEKNPQSNDENLQQTQLTSDTTGSGIEPGPQGWEVSALALRRPGSPSQRLSY